jgi:uncharacterized protein (UPF0147 family)
MADINIKAKLTTDTGDSKEKIDGVNSSLQDTTKTMSGGVGMFSNLKKALAETSIGFTVGGKSAEGFGKGLMVISNNPIIKIIEIIGRILGALAEKFGKMEAVSDALGKAFGTLSGVFSKFINSVLTPLIDGFVWLVDLFTHSVVAILDTLGITSQKTAERMGEITDALDDLEDSEKDAAIATAEANRKLQEAREIAADANIPIKERIEALKLAGKIEKEELDKVVKMNQTKAALTMESIAMELGAKDTLIAKIKEGTLESLKAARIELAAMKNVDKEKLYAIDQQIIAAENAAAQSAKIGKKTEAGIKALQKEDEAAQKEKADKIKAANEKAAAEEKRFQDLKNKLINEANLAAIKDEAELAKQRARNNEKDKLKEVDALKVSEEKKASLRAMIHTSALQEIAKIDKDAAEKKAKEQADFDKALNKLHIETLLAGVIDARAKEQAALDLGFQEKFEQAKEQYKKDSAKLNEVQNELATQQRLAQQTLEDKWKKEDEAKKKEQDKKEAEIAAELLDRGKSPQELELEKLEESYKKKIAIAKDNNDLLLAIDEDYRRQKQALDDLHHQQQIESVSGALGKISEVVGKQTAAGKGLAVAEATINTLVAGTNALKAIKTAKSPVEALAGIATMAAVISSGFKTVKQIIATPVPGASGGGGSTPQISTTAPVLPTQTSTKLDSASIQGVGSAAGAGVGRSFVLSTDIKNDAERAATLNRAARLG